MTSINTDISKKYYIHPTKDLRCSRNCYLNWVKFNQKPPKYHSCKCDSFKLISNYKI